MCKYVENNLIRASETIVSKSGIIRGNVVLYHCWWPIMVSK